MAINRTSPKKGKVVDIPDATITIGTATNGAQQASIAFTVASTPATGGPVQKYTAISSPGSITASATASPVVVTGLTAGTAYTFQVAAANATGSGVYSAASNSVTPTLPTVSVDVLMVAGGGGGLTGPGAAGGAGGLIGYSSYSFNGSTNYAVTIGAGGAANASGVNTTIAGLTTALGGGTGSTSGGSGGGGNYGTGAAGTSGQGNAGGNAQFSNGPDREVQGGGGGAGGVGGNGSLGSNISGAGGIGATYNTTVGGTAGPFAFIDPMGSATGLGQLSSTHYYFAGGGGGGGDRATANPGAGGLGGGGTGGTSSGGAGVAGTANTGGGGGGGGYNYNGGNQNGAGGAGGSGVVIFRYPTTKTITIGSGLTGNTYLNVSGYNYAAITAGSGNVSWA